MAKKVCRGGRGEARWRGILGEQFRSGLSVHAFCRKRQLAESTFYFWRRALGPREGARAPVRSHAPAVGASFVGVQVADERSADLAGRMEIILSGGHRVQVTPPVDGEALAEVLAVLAGESHRREDGRC